jgi:hypothetical protein
MAKIELTKGEAKKLGLIKRGTNADREEIDRIAYRIVGLLAEASKKSVRTSALKKALKLHMGK